MCYNENYLYDNTVACYIIDETLHEKPLSN